MRPSFGSITANQEDIVSNGAPLFNDIKRPSYDIGILERDERVQGFLSDNPEISSESKAKMVNSLYLSDTYKVPYEQAYHNYNGAMSELFGEGYNSETVMKQIQDRFKTNEERFNDYDSGYYNKARSEGKGAIKSHIESMFKKAGDRYDRMGVNMVAQLSGLVEATGDVTFSETLQGWSKLMRKGVDGFMKENPDAFLNPGGDGFWDTTMGYVSNPDFIALGVMEQVPNIAMSYVGGVVGKSIGGAVGATAATVKRAKWLGGVEGFAIPSFGRRYSDLRGQGIGPMMALPEAFLGSQAEGFLEEWSLGKKIQIFKGAGRIAQRGIGTTVARTLLGGAKAYGRGAFEEGSQQVSDNLLAILFRDVDIGLLNDVGAQMAAGGILEATMTGGFHVAGSYSRQVDKTEKLQRLNTFKEKINEAPLNAIDREEINKEIDTLIESVESQSALLGEVKIPEVEIEVAQDEIESTQINSIEEVDGGWAVKNWETDEQVSVHKTEREALQESDSINQSQRRQTLPIEVKSIRQMWSHLVSEGKVTKERQGGYLQGAKDVVRLHGNLAKWANRALSGLNISETHRKQLMNAVSKPRTSAESSKAVQVILRITDQAVHAKSATILRKTVAFINKRIGKSRTEGGIAPDYLEKIKTVTDMFVTKKKLTDKQKKRSIGLAKYLETIKSGESQSFTEKYAEELIPKELIAHVEQLSLKNIEDMNVGELDNINKTLRALLHLNKAKNAIINKRTGERVAEALNSAVEEAEQTKNKSSLIDKGSIELSDRPDRGTNLAGLIKDISKGVINFVAGNKNHDIETLSETIAAGIKGSTFDILANGLSDGREVQNKFVSQSDDIIGKYISDMSLEELQDMSSLFFQLIKDPVKRAAISDKTGLKQTKLYDTFKDADGRTVKMTMAQMMSVYMMTENSETVVEMTKAGVASAKNRLGSITIEGISAIRDMVEKDSSAMNLVEMAKELKKFEASQINETSRELDGVDRASVEAYWHRERYTGGGVAGHQAFRNSLLESAGWLKEREGSGNPVIIRDFFETLASDNAAISEYVGMASPYRNIKNLLKYQGFRKTLQTKGYGEELGLIDTLIERTEQKPKELSFFDNVVAKMMRGLTRSVLANPGIMAGQIASIVPILENEMSTKYASSASLKLDKSYVDRLKGNWHTYRQRIEGMVSSIALKEIGTSDIALRKFTGKQDFINYLTRGIHYVDSIAITAIGRTVEAEMADSNMDGMSAEYWTGQGVDPSSLEKNSPEYWNAFVKRANYVLRRTQPMFNSENRSSLTSETSITAKSLVLFRSYIDQPMRMAYRNINDYSNGRITAVTAAKKMSAIWAGLATYEIIRAAVKKGLFKSDEDEKDLILSILTAPVKTLTIVGFPAQKFISEVVDFKMTGDPIDLRFTDLSPLPLQFVNDTTRHIGSIVKGIGYSGTNDKFKSGKNKGESKSSFYLREGFYGIFSDTMRYYGVPVRQIESLVKEKDKDKAKGFL